MTAKDKQNAAVAALTKLFGRDVLIEDMNPKRLHDWSGISGERPLAVLRPRSTDQLSRMLAVCHAHGQSVVPQGGLTGLVGGAVPRSQDLVVSLERMNRIESIDIDSGTAIVEAGAVLQAVQEACADAGALLALDLGARGSCQIGGNVSTNAGGNRVIRYGNARDIVLGLEVVLADGQVLSMLNQMVKNNAGFDLKHLFIGSEGVLGIITKVVLKLHPLPKGVSTAFVAFHDYSTALRFLRHAQESLSGQISAFEIMWNDYLQITTETCRLNPPISNEYPLYALIDMHYGQREIDSTRFQNMLENAFEAGWILDGAVAQSVSEADSFWAIRDGVADVLSEYAPTLNFDVSVPIGCIGECSDHIRENFSASWPDLKVLFFGHVGDGNLHVVVCAVPSEPADLVLIEEAVYSVVRYYGGSISAEHGIGTLKREWLSYSKTEAELGTMATLKRALDPKNILNPGKVI